MKKLLVLALFSSLILAGCTQQGLSQSELFEKKQECVSYEEIIKKQIGENAESSIGDNLYSLEEIFYSPVKNSCLYSTYILASSEKETCFVYTISDFFSKESSTYITEYDSNGLCDNPKTEEEYKKVLKELKGE